MTATFIVRNFVAVCLVMIVGVTDKNVIVLNKNHVILFVMHFECRFLAF